MPSKPPKFYWRYDCMGQPRANGEGVAFNLNGALQKVRAIVGYTNHLGRILDDTGSVKRWRARSTTNDITVSWREL